jgi:hypothetical protein
VTRLASSADELDASDPLAIFIPKSTLNMMSDPVEKIDLVRKDNEPLVLAVRLAIRHHDKSVRTVHHFTILSN